MSYIEFEQHKNVAILWLDQENSSVNTLSLDMLDEFEQTLDRIESDDAISAAILISRKSDCFVAGADIDAFTKMTSSEDALKLSQHGNVLLKRLAESSKTVIAAINGACLGGGLELALACHYRIGTTDQKTVLGLPEVKLGLLPGGGGTQRLPRQIGLIKSLDLLLTGKNIYPKPAKKMGLVDELIHKPGLLNAAIRAAEKGLKSKPGKRPFWQQVIEKYSFLRNQIFSQAQKKLLHKTQGLYPAPLKILDVVKTGLDTDFDTGLSAESEGFAYLHGTTESKELVRLFLAMQAKKHHPYAELAQKTRKMGMLGAGFMGMGIVQISAEKGISVVLRDLGLEQVSKGLAQISQAWQKKVNRRILSPFQKDQFMANVQASTELKTMQSVDMVLEAVFEDLDLKQKVIEELEQTIPASAWIASNTSALPISQIAEKSKRPDKIIGMHYFSPVPQMPLLEIIVTDKTSQETEAAALHLALQQGKTPVIVQDGPGFYTTRILAAYMNEALELLDEGVDIQKLDLAMKKWGFPVGPIALMDEVGLDVGAHIGRGVLNDLFKDRGIESNNRLQRMSADGLLGRKSSKGFYLYPKQGAKKPNPNLQHYFKSSQAAPDETEWQNRMSSVMVNEAVYCLEEGILRNAEDGDLAAILGLGFPPFRGGPFRYLDTISLDYFVNELEQSESRFGPRFKPAPLLIKMRQEAQIFHGDI